MRIPDKKDSLIIFITIDSDDRELITRKANGLISKVSFDFWQKGYSVSDAFIFSSDNGFKKRFYIEVKPIRENGDSRIDIHDKNLASQYPAPTLESLTFALIKEIRGKEELLSAYVDRTEIRGIDFLENYIVKENWYKYVLK